MRVLHGVLVASSFLAVLARASGADLTVRTLAGDEWKAAALALDGARVQIDSAAGPRSIDASEILWIVASGPTGAPTAEVDDDVTLRLVDGSLLVGRLGESVEDAVKVDVAGIGVVEVPIDVVRAAVFGPKNARPDVVGFDGEADVDRVYRRGAQDTDFVRGTITAIGRDGVHADGDLGKLTLPLEQVAAIVVATAGAETPPADARGVPVELELSTGSVLAGRATALSATAITIAPAFGAPRELSFDVVRRVRLKSTRFRYLSDLTPTKVEQSPFIGGSDDFLFEWQRDRSVSGGPLVVAGKTFGRGLGLHSKSRLTFDLAGGFERLDASVGVSDEVLALDCRGSVVFRVAVDGKAVFESPVLRAGDPARALPSIALAGAKELVIEVDFADEGDVCDRAVLGDPVLIVKSR